MISIKILGTGCKRCNTLELKVKELVLKNNIDASVEKVTEIDKMIEYGIIATPGLVINEKVVSSGIIPKEDKILEWLKKNQDE
ncbi:MAG: TM0996/MTH895 family glutaredoxin-like protein [Ignavibacteriaceae bacterium]|nr:TM0996/MTH895 family glutaredoxin-like protein [Ignavibacteriaceae bacterium]